MSYYLPPEHYRPNYQFDGLPLVDIDPQSALVANRPSEPPPYPERIRRATKPEACVHCTESMASTGLSEKININSANTQSLEPVNTASVMAALAQNVQLLIVMVVILLALCFKLTLDVNYLSALLIQVK